MPIHARGKYVYEGTSGVYSDGSYVVFRTVLDRIRGNPWGRCDRAGKRWRCSDTSGYASSTATTRDAAVTQAIERAAAWED